MSAAAFRKMLDAGLSFEQAVEIAEAFEAGVRPTDTAAEKRRAWDRERKRQERSSGGNPVDIPPDSATVPPFPKPLSTSLEPTPFSPLRGTVSPSRKRTPHGEPDGFAEFWSAYPRRVGKGAAREAYRRALRKIGGPQPGAVLLAALQRAATVWADPEFIPHPATWLNQERWEDEAGPAEAQAPDVGGWTEERWAMAATLYREEGIWAEWLGPKPGEPGCRVPAKLLVVAA